jgi:hypothetical protein
MIYSGTLADNSLILRPGEIDNKPKLPSSMKNGAWRKCKHPEYSLALENTGM